MSIAPTTPDAPVYTDLAGLDALKRGAANKDPAAIRKVAEQFEGLFTRMMLKSMRDAVGPDPMFGSSQEQMYQSMADDQLSVQLSKGKGLGLADMLIRQLQKMGVKGADAAAGSAAAGGAGAHASTSRASGASAYTATRSASGSPTASATVQKGFVQDLWPQAEAAGQQLGVDPRALIAQAALETNWGRNLPQDPAGHSSNNLFGVKASADWSGAAVSSATQEYQNGTATSTTAQFRAYPSTAQSFQDYVALLRGSSRYSAALNTGSDIQAFATGLQRGGYATDPDYVQKLSAMMQNVSGTLSQSSPATVLKSASAEPITPEANALQRL